MRLALEEAALGLRGRAARSACPVKSNLGVTQEVEEGHLVNHLASFLEKIRKCFL